MDQPSPAEPRGGSAWSHLDPLTRLTLSVSTVLAAIVLTGPACLSLLAVLAVLVPAGLAGRLRVVLLTSVWLALPLAFSAVVINLLFSPGSIEVGAWLAAQVVLRVLVMAGAAVLFYATTAPAELVASLQHHGLAARAAFIVHNGVAMIPRLAGRASEVSAAQRARGLDTEGSWLRRGRGVLALAGPTVLGAIRETETRTLALESRGFTRPGRHTVLWPPVDTRLQRLGRWSLLGALVLLLLGRLTDVLPC
jgi:energy-coupling factor transport system permease protein